MKYTLLLFLFATVALVSCKRTEVSRTFGDASFSSVRVGDRADVVLDKCGLPLRCVEVDPIQIGVIIERIDNPTKQQLMAKISARPDHLFRLYYTLQANPRLSYARREILLEKAQVKQVVSSWVEE